MGKVVGGLQVMPFILRRTKDGVLKDLPPKILQDVFCNLSPLQAALYDHISASTSGELPSIADGKGLQASAQTAPHVFQVSIGRQMKDTEQRFSKAVE
jgi:TATA-binding protein-associated factor